MHVFISWSQERAKIVASALHEWLPTLLDGIEPFISSSEILDRPITTMDEMLSKSPTGIWVVTSESSGDSWPVFECGALSRNGPVVPYLIDIEPGDLPAPIRVLHQARRSTLADTRLLVRDLNAKLETPVATKVLETRLQAMWPMLYASIEQALKAPIPLHARDVPTEPSGLDRRLARQLQFPVRRSLSLLQYFPSDNATKLVEFFGEFDEAVAPARVTPFIEKLTVESLALTAAKADTGASIPWGAWIVTQVRILLGSLKEFLDRFGPVDSPLVDMAADLEILGANAIAMLTCMPGTATNHYLVGAPADAIRSLLVNLMRAHSATIGVLRS